MHDTIFFEGGYYVQLLAQTALIYKINKHKSVAGLSWDMQACLLVASLTKLTWVPDTRLFDSIFTYFEVGLTPLAAAACCYLCYKYFHTQAQDETPVYLRFVALAPMSMLLAILFHPGHGYFTQQTIIAFTIYIESVAMIPQLALMHSMPEVEALTSHYVR